MQVILQNLIFGIQTGALYALIALGYTMVYGVLRLINFAHGDVYMVGAFMGYYALKYLPLQDLSKHPEAAGSNMLLAVVGLIFAMGICASLGMVIERFAYRPLRNGLNDGDAHFWGFVVALPLALRFGGLLSPVGLAVLITFGIGFGFALRPALRALRQRIVLSSSRLNALITAIGVSLLLQNGGILVFGSDPQYIPTNLLPQQNIKLSSEIQINSGQLVILIVSLLLMLGLRHIVLNTRNGKAMRAISHDIEAAKLMGINTDQVISFTFALAGALAGAAGAMVAVLTGLKITPLFGLLPGLKAFVAAVLGGAGNIPGAVFGGLIMGVSENLVVLVPGMTSYRDAIAFVLLILILLVRPTGIFGKSVTEKV